jgi:hypothetical protein
MNTSETATQPMHVTSAEALSRTGFGVDLLSFDQMVADAGGDADTGDLVDLSVFDGGRCTYKHRPVTVLHRSS